MSPSVTPAGSRARRTVDGLLLVNFLLMVLRQALETQEQQDADGVTSNWSLIDLSFTAFFFAEMCIKMTVYGVVVYLSSPTNVFWEGLHPPAF